MHFSFSIGYSTSLQCFFPRWVFTCSNVCVSKARDCCAVDRGRWLGSLTSPFLTSHITRFSLRAFSQWGGGWGSSDAINLYEPSQGSPTLMPSLPEASQGVIDTRWLIVNASSLEHIALPTSIYLKKVLLPNLLFNHMYSLQVKWIWRILNNDKYYLI